MLNRDTIQKWMIEDGGNILFDPQNPDTFTGYVTFTKERAELALENNTHNRNLNPNRIIILEEAIRNGWWDENVSKINFEKDGTLSDGQTRLTACAKTGLPVRTLVSWGVDSDAQRKTDRRGARLFSDDLSIEGFKNAHNRASLTRNSYLRNNGHDLTELLGSGHNLTRINDVALFYYHQDNLEEINKEVKLVERIRASIRDLRIPSRVISVLAVEFAKVNENDADSFWKRLHDGIAVSDGDPVFLLRKRLVENSRSKMSRLPVLATAALIIKAWNCFEKGEYIKVLSYRPGGERPEPFPEIFDPYVLEKPTDASDNLPSIHDKD